MHEQTHIPAETRKFSHPQYMRVARWMVDYCNRQTNGLYNGIADHLWKSRVKAGGPALRLSQTVWDFHYRTLYPDDPQRIVEEENSFAHLRYYHMDDAHRQYHVWQAMKLFVKLRTFHYDDEQLLMPTITQPPLSTPHPLRSALRQLDEKAQNPPGYVGETPRLRQILHAISRSNPTDEAFLLKVIDATDAYADWLLDTTSSEAFALFQKKTNTALNIRYRNQAYLENKNPQLDLAIGLLGRSLKNPPPDSSPAFL